MRTVGLVIAGFMFGMIAGNACTSKKTEAVVVADGGSPEATSQVVVTPTSGTSEAVVKSDSSPSVQEITPSQSGTSSTTTSTPSSTESTQK